MAAAFTHSLVIEAYWALCAGDTKCTKELKGSVTLMELMVWETADSQTITQTDVRFQLRCELHGALRVLTFEC